MTKVMRKRQVVADKKCKPSDGLRKSEKLSIHFLWQEALALTIVVAFVFCKVLARLKFSAATSPHTSYVAVFVIT